MAQKDIDSGGREGKLLWNVLVSGGKILDSVKSIYASDIFDGFNNILVMACFLFC